ncbi:MAG: TolC family protein [Candidatus Acidiferrales bacterium]
MIATPGKIGRCLRCALVLAITSAYPIAAFAQSFGNQGTASAPGRRLTLQDAFSIAEKQNLDIAAARLRRMVALAGITIAGERPNPTVSFAVSRDTPHETLFFDLPVELGSKRGSRMETARQETSLTDVEISTVSRQVRRAVRDAFFASALATSIVEQQMRLVELATKLRDIAKTRFDAGDVPQLEVMQAELELSRAQADLEVARQESKVTFGKLSALLNEPAGTTWELVTPLDTMPQQVVLQDLVARATGANPELQHLAQELKVEQSREKAIRAEQIPDVSLEAGTVLNAPPDYRAGAFGQLTVGLPIFTRFQGELAQSAATRKLIEGEALAARRSVEGDVEAAYNEFNARMTEVRLYRETVIPAGRKLEALAEESYSAGRTSILAVLDAQRNVQQNERDYLQSLFELQQAFAELEEIVGVPLD